MNKLTGIPPVIPSSTPSPEQTDAYLASLVAIVEAAPRARLGNEAAGNMARDYLQRGITRESMIDQHGAEAAEAFFRHPVFGPVFEAQDRIRGEGDDLGSGQ